MTPMIPPLRARPRATLVFIFACILVCALTSWVLWPGIYGPELLDDRSSIAVLVELQANPERAWEYVFGDRSGTFGRSVSMITFVLERLYFDAGTLGNKRVNIILHCINGALVIWLFTLLLRARQVPAAHWLALLLGSCWLLHPLQVSTVLYVVQRMAMLSTFFMLLALIAYLYWRSRVRSDDYRLVWLAPVALFTVIGALAKENAVLVVPVVLLMETLWLQCRDRRGRALVLLRHVTWGLIVGGAIAGVVLLLFSSGYLEGKYRYRPFTLEERVLTQGPILWDYVSQWFMPDVHRMGIYHDDWAWSTSLTDPIGTLWAWLAWSAVGLLCLLGLRWSGSRLMVFGVGWFLAGHVMESTVWPLELYFEHRNYFPALGLLVLIAVPLGAFMKRWPETTAPLLAGLMFVPVILSMLTSSQAQIWSSRPLLIVQHVNGHPQSSRANTDMAVQMARLGSAERALDYSQRAFESSFVEREGDRAIRDIALLCVARAPVSETYIARIGAQDPHRPLSSVTTLLTLVRMVQDGHCPTIDREAFSDHLASIYLEGEKPASASPNTFSSLAVLENALQNFERAYAYNSKMLTKRPRSKRGQLMQLHFATALGKQDEAAQLVKVLQEMDREGKLTLGEKETLALYVRP